MGPDNSPPVQLFFLNEETGERTALCSTISELSITEKEGDEPMTVKLVNEVGMQNIGRYKTGRWYGRVCEDGKQ